MSLCSVYRPCPTSGRGEQGLLGHRDCAVLSDLPQTRQEFADAEGNGNLPRLLLAPLPSPCFQRSTEAYQKTSDAAFRHPVRPSSILGTVQGI
jgi:hypothetical protein